MTTLATVDRSSPGAQRTRRVPRIGLYLPDYRPSGPLRYVESVAAEVDADEFEVVFLSNSGPVERTAHGSWVESTAPASRDGQQAGPIATDLSSSLMRSAAPRWLRLHAGFVRDALRLARRFRETPVDLLHTSNTGCEESPLAARLAGVPRVLGTFQVDPTYDLERERSGLAHRLLEMLSNHCLHRAIGVSDDTLCRWAQRTWLPARRVARIHSGVDPEHFQRRQSTSAARRQLGLPGDDTLLIGGVGRLEPAKGFRYLVDAVAALRGQGYDVQLALAGTGNLGASLEQQAESQGIRAAVHFLGFVSDPRIVYDALDVFAFPSMCESLGYALLEAMAHQLPTVASNVGGIPEVVVHGETGSLVPSGEAVGLVAALTRLMQSPELRRQQGAAGRKRVERCFQQRDMARRTIEIYRELLATTVKV